jgi:hypothetical protein
MGVWGGWGGRGWVRWGDGGGTPSLHWSTQDPCCTPPGINRDINTNADFTDAAILTLSFRTKMFFASWEVNVSLGIIEKLHARNRHGYQQNITKSQTLTKHMQTNSKKKPLVNSFVVNFLPCFDLTVL